MLNRGFWKPKKLLCHLTKDLPLKYTLPSWPLLSSGIWSTVWSLGSWAHLLSVGAPSGVRKGGVDKSHSSALSCLQPVSQPGVRERSWSMLPSLPVIMHDFQPLPYKALDYWSLVGEIQQSAERLLCSGDIWLDKKSYLMSPHQKLFAFPSA